MKTFLFQGDSITDANRDDENQDNFGLGCGYALLLASDIEKNRKGEIKFINRGKSGDRITDVYARIKEDIINIKPDYMSILIGVNDVWHEINDKDGVEPLKFEIPVVIAGNDKPIIWLGGYQSVYYNYDSIQIPFLVYNPSDTTKAVIHLYKNRIEIGTRDITSFSGFSYWEIADADLD